MTKITMNELAGQIKALETVVAALIQTHHDLPTVHALINKDATAIVKECEDHGMDGKYISGFKHIVEQVTPIRR